jgi:rhodanese-related sulfurtransferase
MSVFHITPTELKAELDAGLDLFLLDLRNQDEFAQWRIEGRKPIPTLNIPYFEFLEDEAGVMAQLPKDQEITLICAKGGASE